MDKKKFFDFLFLFLIICLIAFLIFVVKYMTGYSGQCLKDPPKFFEDMNEGAECKVTCVKDGITWPNTSKVVSYGEERTYEPINISKWNLTG